MVRNPVGKVSEDQLQKDLERYRLRAIELGATDAKVITMDTVFIDERVVAKCTYPKCDQYGTSANCPPYAMDPDRVRKVVNNFRYGIFIKLEVPTRGAVDIKTRKKRTISAFIKLAEIIAKIEANAFYDGYYLAVGFGGGSCKPIFCPDEDCQALVLGQSCRHRFRARSSMEAVGMDCFSMATKVGWDIYPIGGGISPEEVPYALRLGLVLIA
ncbi:DUF2284 domain-containing protein [Chloroflexota bacterium]